MLVKIIVLCVLISTYVFSGQSLNIPNITESKGTKKYYTINVPANSTALNVLLSNVTGDPDMYVRYGEKPTLSTYDCRPYEGLNTNETCNMDNPQAGTWHIMIDAYKDFSGATLTADIVGGDSNGSVIVDTIAPVITLNGTSSVTLHVGETYTDAGAVASDNVDGNITANIQTIGNVDTTKVGTYSITYAVTDASNNSATVVNRTVNVGVNYTISDITQLLEDAAIGVEGNLTYVAIHDSNRDMPTNMLAYYATQLQKINVNFVEEVRSGYSSKLFLSSSDNFPGACTLQSFSANPNISQAGEKTLIEFGLGRNDRGQFNEYIDLKESLKTAIVKILLAKPQAKLFLVTPKHHPSADSQNTRLRRAYNEISNELQIPLLDMKDVSLPEYTSPDSSDYHPAQNGGQRDDYYYRDQIHFNESGGRRVVNYIFSNIGSVNVFDKMYLEEFSDAGRSYQHKTIAQIHLGLSEMNLHVKAVVDNTSVPMIDNNFTIDLSVVANYNANDSIEEQYLSVVNHLRSLRIKCNDASGFNGPVGRDLTWNTFLKDAAKEHSDDMLANNNMTHAGSGTQSDITGQTFNPAKASTASERMNSQGYDWIRSGENISHSAAYPKLSETAWIQAMEGWMKSHTGHCSNIMNPNFRDFGMAEARGTSDVIFSDGVTRTAPVAYWTQNFGTQ